MTPERVCVVTGASSGIGRAFALVLARRGDLVIAIGRNPDRLAALDDDLRRAGPEARHRVVGMDVASPGDMDKLRSLAEGLGGCDLLICSAAVGRGLGGRALPPPTAELPLSDWQAMIDVNLNGVFLANMAVLPAMRSQGDGDIVNIGSSTTPRGLRGTALAPGYAATKFALAEYGHRLAAEVGPEGVRVRTIFPGPVDTPLIEGTMMDGAFGGRMSDASFTETVLDLVDLGREMDLVDPHLLPVPARRKRTRRG